MAVSLPVVRSPGATSVRLQRAEAKLFHLLCACSLFYFYLQSTTLTTIFLHNRLWNLHRNLPARQLPQQPPLPPRRIHPRHTLAGPRIRNHRTHRPSQPHNPSPTRCTPHLQRFHLPHRHLHLPQQQNRVRAVSRLRERDARLFRGYFGSGGFHGCGERQMREV
jgi:hypothetical protein